MSNITLDTTLMMEVNIGDGGLSDTDLANLSPKLTEALSTVQTAVASGELGFWKLPSEPTHLEQVRERVAALTFDPKSILVLGIGGSSLGPRMVTDFWNLSAGKTGRDIAYLDNADPTSLRRILKDLSPAETLVVVTSKSGSTVETLSAFLVTKSWIEDAVGEKESKNHFVFITDPENGFLRKRGKEEGIAMLPVPANVGGRFSVFTAVGLLPAFLAGVPCDVLVEGAAKMALRCETPTIQENPAMLGAAHHYLMDQKKKRNQSVLMPYTDSLRTLGDWFVQLWGESIGKPTAEGPVGPTPLRAVGSTDQHSLLQLLMEGPDNKHVCFVQIDEHRDPVLLPDHFPDEPALGYLGGKTLEALIHAERRATALALASAGRPSMTVHFPNESIEHLGALLFLLEAQTAIAGGLYGINAFDQPGVEAGKILTNALMGRAGSEKDRENLETTEAQLISYRL